MPPASVAAVANSTEPPPSTTAKPTVTPARGSPVVPVTRTWTESGTGIRVVARCPLPAWIARSAGTSSEVALKTTGSRPMTVARSCCDPGSPMVQAPGEAVPSAPVTAVSDSTDPPPCATTKLTVAPSSASPVVPVTST